MGEPGKTGRHDDGRSSFDRLCEDLVRQLESPSGDDEGGEGQNPNGGPPFFLAQKRWSSLSELTAFFQDLGNDGESNRTSTITLPDQNNQTGEYIDVFAREPRRPRTINGTLTTLLVEQATGQAGGGDGGRGRRESEDGPDKAVPRASIHMLMHAMAAVDAASDEGDDDGVKNLARL
eukprot:g8113.t1